ncbi:MAG: ribonuclease HI family protein [bacterium TMED46]|nr:MAG: ribonuclease HI family protein [bacterium TMED46]|tara:strand:+ start:1029 stop:1556 length:528 start_codon:yes stop_codon:yes gene_type:complete
MNKLTQLQRDALKEALKLDGLSIEHKNTLKALLDSNKNNEITPKLFVDGAADLHSKTAGIGGVVYINEGEVANFSEPLYDKTNNESEYLSLIKGIQVIHELKFGNVLIYSDSELIVKQVTGEYKIKNDRMKKLNDEVKLNLRKLTSWSIEHVRREKNTRADELSKLGMEEARGSK